MNCILGTVHDQADVNSHSFVSIFPWSTEIHIACGIFVSITIPPFM